MSTVGKTIADKEIARCEKSKQPRMYCIASYVNTSDGQQSYKLCYRPENYTEMMSSPFVGKVVLLWQSERMKRDHISSKQEKRPPYPKKMTCNCSGDNPEWEWQFEDVWSCLGCGKMIEGKSGRDPLAK